MFGPFKGIVILGLLLVSMLFGCSGLLFAAPLMFFPSTRKLFRRICELFQGTWFCFAAFLLENIAGVEVFVSADQAGLAAMKRKSLLVLNHRTEIDWLLTWILVVNVGLPDTLKIALKAALKYFPGGGWGTQVLLLLFLNRKWEEDEDHITRYLQHFTEIDYPMQLLLFPEGTDFSDAKLKKSHDYAEKHNLPKTQMVLLPRTTGFCHIVNELRDSDYSLVDLTVSYPPEYLARVGREAGMGMLKGIFPKRIDFHIQATPLDSLPKNNNDLCDRLMSMWTEKDARLQEAYGQRQGRFSASPVRISKTNARSYSSAVGWLVFTVGGVLAVYYTRWGRYALGFVIFVYSYVTRKMDGFDRIFVNLATPSEMSEAADKKKD